MTVTQSLLSFLFAAGLLTASPGLDTALIIRTGAAGGPGAAFRALSGCVTGVMLWGVAAALGLSALLAASHLAYRLLSIAGAGYLIWIGLRLLVHPRRHFDPAGSTGRRCGGWYRQGLAQNLLNPKVGVFFISFLPQFVPQGWPPGPTMLGLAAAEAAIGAAWFTVLILAMRPLLGALRRASVLSTLDRVTGGVFLAFGASLALARR